MHIIWNKCNSPILKLKLLGHMHANESKKHTSNCEENHVVCFQCNCCPAAVKLWDQFMPDQLCWGLTPASNWALHSLSLSPWHCDGGGVRRVEVRKLTGWGKDSSAAKATATCTSKTRNLFIPSHGQGSVHPSPGLCPLPASCAPSASLLAGSCEEQKTPWLCLSSA